MVDHLPRCRGPERISRREMLQVGGAGLLIGNKGRIVGQRGVGASTIAKLALTAAALGVTAYSRALGKKLEQADGVPVEGGTEPGRDSPADIAKAQQQLKINAIHKAGEQLADLTPEELSELGAG